MRGALYVVSRHFYHTVVLIGLKKGHLCWVRGTEEFHLAPVCAPDAKSHRLDFVHGLRGNLSQILAVIELRNYAIR